MAGHVLRYGIDPEWYYRAPEATWGLLIGPLVPNREVDLDDLEPVADPQLLGTFEVLYQAVQLDPTFPLHLKESYLLLDIPCTAHDIAEANRTRPKK